MKLVIKITAPLSVSKKFQSSFQAAPNFTKLQNRALMIVHGAQTRKLLQGLTTNNISLLYDEQDKQQPRVSLYTLFLNPKGRIITDAFIIRPHSYKNNVKFSPNDQLWIDVCKNTSTSLFEHLRKYTWKKNVEILNLQYEEGRPDVYAGFNKVILKTPSKHQQLKSKTGKELNLQSQKVSTSIEQDGAYANLAFFDPRSVNLGLRLICGHEGFKYEGQNQKVNQSDYLKFCMMNGLSSSKSMVGKLPFMFNSDLFNGFSFRKGCYLGQQIVARAYFTGIVRRRIFPFVLQSDKTLAQGQTLYTQNKIQIGKVFDSRPGFGTVLSNYLPLMQQKWPLKFEQPIKGEVKMPFEAQLRQYIKETKQKQTKLQQIDL